MRRLYYLLPVLLFILLAAYFAVGLSRDPSRLESVLINQQVPDFSLAPIAGRIKGLQSADLKGQVSLVNIFGSWCVACRIEHPFLMALKKGNVIPIYGIDWREENRQVGPAWLKKFGDPYTLIGDDPVSKGAIAFGVSGAPETFFIDRKGVIRHKHLGPMNRDIWEKKLFPLVQKLRNEK